VRYCAGQRSQHLAQAASQVGCDLAQPNIVSVSVRRSWARAFGAAVPGEKTSPWNPGNPDALRRDRKTHVGREPSKKVGNLVIAHSSCEAMVETNFMVWAQAGIEDSLESFLKSLANVNTIMLGRATYEDLVRKWPKVKEWPHVSDVALRNRRKDQRYSKSCRNRQTSTRESRVGRVRPPTQLSGTNIEDVGSEAGRSS
jgi:hypothetical protein